MNGDRGDEVDGRPAHEQDCNGEQDRERRLRTPAYHGVIFIMVSVVCSTLEPRKSSALCEHHVRFV